MELKRLVGSGERIGLFTLPFLAVGVILNVVDPTPFEVGGPSPALRTISILAVIPGVAVWIWSVVLILRDVPRHRLITTGPYAFVRHPLYTDVALLVVPWVGFLLNTWLGAVIGVVIYAASRFFAPAEEAELSQTFGARWTVYRNAVVVPWL